MAEHEHLDDISIERLDFLIGWLEASVAHLDTFVAWQLRKDCLCPGCRAMLGFHKWLRWTQASELANLREERRQYSLREMT